MACLVPRKAIAIGLANYILKVRGSKIGAEIGLGTGDEFLFSPVTKIAFFTYVLFSSNFFRRQNFSKLAAVILDEAHERNPGLVLITIAFLILLALLSPPFLDIL